MQKLFVLIGLSLILSSGKHFAQQSILKHEIDSISGLLKADHGDTNTVKQLNRIARNYSYLYMLDSVTRYVDASLRLNDQLNQKLQRGTGPEKQIRYTLLKAKGNSHSVMGGAFYESGKYPEALKSHFTSLKIFESVNNKKGISAAYGNIGLVYYFQGNFKEALKNHRASLKIDEELGDKTGIATAFNNLGIVYADQGDLAEAMKCHEASLKIKNELNDQPGLAASYNNLGRLNYKMGNYNDALKNNMECLKLYEALEDEEGMALSYFNLGDVYLVQKKYKEAEQSFMQARRLSLKVNYRLNLKFIYQSLAELYRNRKDFKKAFENQAMFILYNDSISNEETKKQTIQMQMTYDFEKKEAVADAEHKKEIENQKVLAHEKNRKQTIIITVTIIVLLLVMIFAAFIFRSLRTTRKQKAVIESQKSEVEHQKHLVEEKQKEIIDSITYAKRLQKAILPSDEDLRKHLPDSFVLYQPKDIVAGDFYWMHVSNDLVFIAAADSTGHGVPGAMVSVVCSNALNRAVDEFQLSDTGQILDKARDLVLETFAKSGEEIKDGMDISLLCINKVSNVISWSGANNQLWYIQNETFKEIKASKQAIGKTDEPKPFTTHKLEVNTGDIFYLMTDGYPDQFGGPKGKKYKYKSLEEKLISISHLTLTEQQEILTNVFNNWKGGLEQVDDVTIIGIKI